MPKQYLTVNEVARIIGVSPLTVRNWDQKGRLRAYRNPINNYRLYKINDVEILLQKIAGSREKKFPKKEWGNQEKNIAKEVVEEKPAFKKIKIEME